MPEDHRIDHPTDHPIDLNTAAPVDGVAQPTWVLRPDELPAKSRGGGCRTVPLLTHDRGATAFLNGTTLFDPGAQIAHHSHNVLESVMVVQGSAIVDIGGRRTRLQTFDTTVVPAGIEHHFENASDTEPMRIFWTYASVDATRTMADSGETSRIDAEAPGEPGATEAGTEGPVLEIVDLVAAPGAEEALEQAVAAAAPLFQASPGARTYTLRREVEDPSRYRLFVAWDALDDHLVGFRESEAFQDWRALVTPHLAEPPSARHVRHTLTGF
ncbi:cupin domain-containing protein [Arsenicicoccus piscis]|uniref:ABM domain-containing protein n=1 Tax=Arsenicicoccus piscis TaxID=673954 RepID=A0ABQ6HKU3_9MICO|nr:cupin domain-containing protein [Arsenicicoccus piscis]MCH8628347.1 cupin domain-containing protein [Arsenicicoccus piscis]GMA18617.1 hypothetical protein GCM10025862_06380 [Arsenicicoccus piscis]